MNTEISSKKLLTLILLLVPLQQLAIDQYLPSLPAMVHALHTDSTLVKLSLTVYILTLGFSQFFYGPLAEKIGRKPTALIGLFIFLSGTTLSCFSHDINMFLLSRLIQGFGAGCGFVCVTAIMGDSFSGKQLARYTSYSSSVYSLAPLLAPVLGGIIQTYLFWQANFIVVSLYSVLLIVLLALYLPETLKQKNPSAFAVKKMFGIYKEILSNRAFCGYVGCQLFAFAIMIAFNVVGPFLCQDILGVSPLHYGQILLLLGAAYLSSTYTNSILVHNFCEHQLMVFGVVLMLLSTAVLACCSLLGLFNIWLVILASAMLVFGTGFIFPNAYSSAISLFPHYGGQSGALMGALGLMGNAVISAIIAPFAIHTGLELALVYLLITLCTAISVYLPTTVPRNKSV